MSDTTELTAQPEANLMSIIAGLASRPEVDIDKLHRLLEMQEKWELSRDKRALREAMAEFKKNPPRIVKDRKASFEMKSGGKKEYDFADLEAVTFEAQIALAQHGVTHGYVITEATSGLITVTCTLKFGMYDEPGATLTGAPDASGNKNDMQAKGSTLSYLEKYTFLAAAGLSSGMPDNDANAGPDVGVRALAEDIYKSADAATLQHIWQVAYAAAEKRGDKAAMKEYDGAREARLAEFLAADVAEFKVTTDAASNLEEINTLVKVVKERKLAPPFRETLHARAVALGFTFDAKTKLYAEVSA